MHCHTHTRGLLTVNRYSIFGQLNISIMVHPYKLVQCPVFNLMYYVCPVDYGHDNAIFFFAVHMMSN